METDSISTPSGFRVLKDGVTQRSGTSTARQNRKRLLLLTHYYPAHRGGIEIVAGQLASRLAANSEVLWLAADCDPPPDIPGVVCRPQHAWNGLETKGLPWPIWSLQGWRNLKRAVAECDILHVHDFIYPANLAAILLARHFEKPVVITQHIGDIEYRSLLLRTILKTVNRTLGRLLLGKASQVIFISPRVKNAFESFARFSRRPLYWPNGVDTRTFRPVDPVARTALRDTHGLSANKPVLLFVGRFVERKGLHFIQQMAQARPEWQWCFAGWGPIDPAAWNLPNVHIWKGLQGDSLAALYRLADLLILPSHGEGFPLVVQEALACGTPAVVSEETAAGGPTIPGCIIPVPFSPLHPDSAPWLAAIENCLNNENREDCRHECAEKADSLWNWMQLANSYGELFEQLLSTKPCSIDPKNGS